MIRRPTSPEVGLVGQREKASLEGAGWTRETYHGSKNELRPHTVRGGLRARARRPGDSTARAKTQRFGATGG